MPKRISQHVIERRMEFDRVVYISLNPLELIGEEARYIAMFKPRYNKAGLPRENAIENIRINDASHLKTFDAHSPR